MNILWMSWRGPGHPLSGGAELVSWKHMVAWSRAGHSVTLFTSSYSGGQTKELLEGVTVIRSGGQAIGVKIRGFLWYLKNRNKFNLVVDEFHGIPFLVPLYRKKPTVAYIHEVAGKTVWKLNAWPFPASLLPAVIGPFLESIILMNIYKNVEFITVSQSTANDLKKHKIKKIIVIENGIDIVPKNIAIKKKENPQLIYLSSLAKDKGIEDVLKVFKEVLGRVKSCKLAIVGKGSEPYVNYLQDYAKKLGIEKFIHFYGYVPEKTKYELLAQSHLLLNCSVHEGWGLVNLEANQVGTPVIGYAVSGTIDSVKPGESGVLVPPYHIKKMADVVVELLKSSAVLMKMSRSSQRWSKKFSWKNSTQKSLKYISKYDQK